VSKIVGLKFNASEQQMYKIPGTDSVAETFKLVLWINLLSCCFLKLSRSAITNPINVEINTIFLNHTVEK